jgi:hypothetical protein
VAFESGPEFNASIEEIVHNSVIELSIEKLKDELKRIKARNSHASGDMTNRLAFHMNQLESYDLIEISKSFFAYQPVMKTLQSMETVPFSE